MSATITASSAADELLDTMRALLAGHHDGADLDELDTLADKLGKAVSTAKRRARALRKKANPPAPKPTAKAEPKPTTAVATLAATQKPPANASPPAAKAVAGKPVPSQPATPKRTPVARIAVAALIAIGIALAVLSPTGYAVTVFAALAAIVGALVVHTFRRDRGRRSRMTE